MDSNIEREVRETLRKAESVDAAITIDDLDTDQKVEYMKALALTSIAGSQLVIAELLMGMSSDLSAISRHTERISNLL